MKDYLIHSNINEILKFSQKLLDGYSYSEIYHEGLIDNYNTLLFWKDYKSRLLYCNNKFAEVTGITRLHDAIGKQNCGLHLRKELLDSYIADDHAVISMRYPKINIIEPLLSANGKEVILLTGKFPITSRDRKKVGIVGISSIITSLQKTPTNL